MKTYFLAVSLLGLLVSGGYRDLQAQAYGFYYQGPPPHDYYTDPYGGGVQIQQYRQEYDPYYQLHLMHYRGYLPLHGAYGVYQPCCYFSSVPIWSSSIRRPPRRFINPRLRPIDTPRAPMVVGPLPPAVGPLPRATPRR